VGKPIRHEQYHRKGFFLAIPSRLMANPAGSNGVPKKKPKNLANALEYRITFSIWHFQLCLNNSRNYAPLQTTKVKNVIDMFHELL